MYINGKFVESRSGKWIDVLNPSTEEVCSRQPEGTVEDVEEALDAARAAQKSWEKTPAIERAAYLSKMADGIRKREKEFVEIIMREQGKTRSWAQIEVGATIAYFDYMASFARHIEGEIIQSDNRGETIFLSKKPIGVVAGILPWNFPFFLIARKAGAALIAGCSIVIKPAQLTPENCTVFAEVVDETGLPAGLFNVVTGKGSVVGNALASSPKIDIVSVTGSVGAGESIMKAAATNITKVSLELGGKAPVIVFPDADLELAAQAILDSRIGNNGQICNNAERLYIHKDVKEKLGSDIEHFHFREALKEAMNLARIGNKYLADTEPWKLAKTDMARVATIMNLALQITANLAIAFEPFLPFSAQKLRAMLNMPEANWDKLGTIDILPAGAEVQKPQLLFEKIDDETIQQQLDKLEATKKANEDAAYKAAPIKDTVSFEDFEKLDIRVGHIKHREKVKKSKKLLKFTIDDGSGIDRTILSGIAAYYEPEQLIGKDVLFVANFAPRKMMGIESQGMILSAVNADDSLHVTTTLDGVKPGSQVG